MSVETEQPEIPERKHSLFADPSINQSINEDPFVRFISQKWKGILTFCLVLAAGFYLRSQMLETSLARVKESSQVFDQARVALDVLSNKSAEISPEEKQKMQLSLKDSLESLKSGAEPYSELSSLYSVVSSTFSSDQAAAGLVVDDALWKSESKPELRLIKELQTLAAIRTKIDGSEGLSAVAPNLKELIREGQYVDLSAYMMLARIVESSEDKQFVKDNAAEIKNRYSEKADKIDLAIAGL